MKFEPIIQYNHTNTNKDGHRWIYDMDTMNQFFKLGFEDCSYGNDLVDSIWLKINEEQYFQIMMSNSNVDNYDEECFASSYVHIIDGYEPNDIIFETEDIEELLSMFKSLECLNKYIRCCNCKNNIHKTCINEMKETEFIFNDNNAHFKNTFLCDGCQYNLDILYNC